MQGDDVFSTTTYEKNLDVTETRLPDPQVYVIINSKPTTQNIIWRSLIDIRKVKATVTKLQHINWLYKDIHDDAVDESALKVIEVVNKASSTMLVKANTSDIASFQSYTIRNLDNKLINTSDIDQYKLQNIKEEPINNRQAYLDVMCFPKLFPTGQFGEHHHRVKKITAANYIKSRLLNVDARFHKDPQYVFFLLWQKELRELNAGVYNVLKTYRSQPTNVNQLLSGVNSSDDELEHNLSTMLRSVRDTKQYWFHRFSEVKQ